MHNDETMIPRPGVQSAIVYVREVKPAEIEGMPTAANVARKLYAIHDETGARLALTDDRALAFTLARRNDRTPVSVH